ncbi:MAG: hypothetical protein DRJ14_06310 [Acidobacteria bacterium]|nr:MAG: hypothetical protein DRJ14_06310 [Acidobacteriota bacterium]
MIKKIIRLLVVLILVVIFGVLVYVHTPMFRAMVKHDIERQLSNATGEKLHIEKLSITPLSGQIHISNIALADIASIGKLSLKVSVAKLFLFKLIVESATVDNVTVHIRLQQNRSSFRSDPMKLIAAGFDTLVLKKLDVRGLTLDIQGRDNLHVVFEGRDFLLQGGFDAASFGYRGIVAFSNGHVTVNGIPYVLHVGCGFDIQKDRIRITELTIAKGKVRLAIKGEMGKNGNLFFVSGVVPLKEVTKFPELQKAIVNFQLKGDFSSLKGPIQIHDPRGEFNGILDLNLDKKMLSLLDLHGKLLKHTVSLAGSASLANHLAIVAKAVIHGPLMKDFSADIRVDKKKRWSYSAVIHGQDCGDGACHLEIRSGKKPILRDIALNLPFLTSHIKNNRGSLHLKLDWVDAKADGIFLDKDIFSGKLAIQHLQYSGMTVPFVTADVAIHSIDNIEASRFTLQAKGGRADGVGSFRNNRLDLTAHLLDFPLHASLFALPGTDDLAIHGRADGSVQVSGDLNDPDVSGTATLQKTDIFQLLFDKASTSFQYHGGILLLKNLNLENGTGSMKGKGTVDFRKNSLTFKLRGEDMKVLYQPLDFIELDKGTGEVTVSGLLDAPQVDAEFQFEKFSVAGLDLGGGEFRFHLSGDKAEVNAATRNRLKINTAVNLNGETKVSLVADNTPIRIEKADVISALHFHCIGDFNDLSTFSGNGSCTRLTIQTPEGIRLDAVPFPFYLDGMWLTGDEVRLKGPEMNYLVNIPFTNFESGEVGGEITGTSTLSAFKSLIKRELGVAAEASVQVQAELDGMLADPLYHGTLIVSNGKVTIPDLPHKLREVSGICEFGPALLNIRKASAAYGRGNITASGILSPGLISIDAELSKIPVDLAGIFSDVNGRVKLNGNPNNDRLNLGGNVELANGVISPRQLALGNPAGGGTVLEKLNLNLDVATKGLEVLDPSMSLGLAPSQLKLKGPADSPILLGFQPLSCDSVIYINDIPLRVRSGGIRFENAFEIDPQVEIIAGTKIDGYDISCRLLGSGNQVKLNFSSRPPLPQKDLYALIFGSGGLATGGSTFMQTETRSQDIQGAGVALALNNLFAPLQNRVKRRLGVQRFSITPQMFDARSTPSPIVTFEKDISSRLTGIYSQSLIGSGENLLQFKYNMAGKKSAIVRKEIDGSVTVEIEFEK